MDDSLNVHVQVCPESRMRHLLGEEKMRAREREKELQMKDWQMKRESKSCVVNLTTRRLAILTRTGQEAKWTFITKKRNKVNQQIERTSST